MEDYKKILKCSKVPLIIAVIIIVISIVLFTASAKLDSQEQQELVAKDYNELIAYEQDVENEYVEITITDIPYEFAEEEVDNVTRSYYFVFDENDYMYIVRLTDSTYRMLENIYNENPEEFSYVLKGYIFEDPEELKELAISEYNEAVGEKVVNEENFRLYFGNTYLDETVTPYTDTSSLLLGIGVGISVIAVVLLVVYIIGVVKLKSALKKYDKEDLEYELEKASTVEYKKANIYLTDKYVISKVVGLTVLEYRELVWLYNEKRRQNGIPVGIFLIAYTDKKKRYQIASTNNNEDMLNEIMIKIKEKNSQVMIGYTKENKEKYKEIKKNKQDL